MKIEIQMKNKANLLKLLFAFILLFELSFTSCKKHCETCVKINPVTLEVIDKLQSCEKDAIQHLESRGYSCD